MTISPTTHCMKSCILLLALNLTPTRQLMVTVMEEMKYFTPSLCHLMILQVSIILYTSAVSFGLLNTSSCRRRNLLWPRCPSLNVLQLQSIFSCTKGPEAQTFILCCLPSSDFSVLKKVTETCNFHPVGFPVQNESKVLLDWSHQ